MKILFAINAEFWMVRRAEILYEGLKENNVDVVECFGNKKFYFRLLKHFYKKNYDVILVHGMMPFLFSWLLKPIHRKKIVYDVFISRYNTEVEDRQKISKNSLKAKLLFFLDKFTCEKSDIAFLDTKSHVNYFKKTFGIKKDLKVIYVGANEKLWIPNKYNIIKNNKFNVVFWGAFSPLHGADIIVKTAKLLEKEKDIEFHLLGFSKEKMFGQCNEEIEGLVENSKNVKLKYGITLSTTLIDYANSADICLGIFGNTKKANMVLPHKAFETLALKKPLITMDSIAAREIFQNNKQCILINPNEKELSKAVLKLKKDIVFRRKIAEKGYEFFKNNLNNKHIGESLLKIIKP